ncbi:hypothetical protein [Mycolicibacterium tokaiense]|uniref:hypothetical protein n=1 Tax=Mycolicibacterium tokaiense TaxID=39695 RepID=UPI0011C06E0E|nr:hypothetical protein [Mycolicibacterium tokaiense]
MTPTAHRDRQVAASCNAHGRGDIIDRLGPHDHCRDPVHGGVHHPPSFVEVLSCQDLLCPEFLQQQ